MSDNAWSGAWWLYPLIPVIYGAKGFFRAKEKIGSWFKKNKKKDREKK